MSKAAFEWRQPECKALALKGDGIVHSSNALEHLRKGLSSLQLMPESSETYDLHKSYFMI